MKVFLSGASGILGTDLQAELQNDHHEVRGYNSKEINIADAVDVRTKIMDFKPDIVIHSAAMTNVDFCEEDKEAAFLANVIGTQNMAAAARQQDVPIVYISSCGVYGKGKMRPYRETDQTVPVNYHHFTKLEGEKRVKNITPNHIIVRPGWLFGGKPTHKKNFVEARRKEAMTGHDLKSATDKFGSPTYTVDLAKQIIELINADVSGTYNAVNTGAASRFDYVSAIVQELKIPARVVPVSSDSFPRKAIMPENEMLINAQLNLLRLNIMRPWKEALSAYISSLR